MREITWTGQEAEILEIMEALSGKAKAIRVYGRHLTIPTDSGAKTYYLGDVITIEGGKVVDAKEGDAK